MTFDDSLPGARKPANIKFRALQFLVEMDADAPKLEVRIMATQYACSIELSGNGSEDTGRRRSVAIMGTPTREVRRLR